MPREGALDSATILMISNYARMKVDNLKTDFLKFEPIEYSEKLVSDMDFEVNLSVYMMYNYECQSCVISLLSFFTFRSPS